MPEPRAGDGQEDLDEDAPDTRDPDIVLTGGKTLSDYLEEESEPTKTGTPAEYRSIPNVQGLVVPPPAGVREAETKGSDPGARGVTPAPAPAEDEDFGRMLEGSLRARSFEAGERVRGRIVAIGPEVAFLDIGGKSEASIAIEELKDAEGDVDADVGDIVEALVVSTEGGLKLSRKLARGAAAKEQLAGAFRAGLPVEGRVEKTIKGGYEVRVAGLRAFCPVSQIDLVRTTDTSVHEGKVYTFRIIEYKEGGRNLVVSRRAVLQEEEKERAEETRKAIVPGAVLKGRIVSVREFGAFVDLGGIQGLVHVSEMGWARVTNPSEVVKPGDEVTVKVLGLDETKGKISLGMKQLQADPWSRVAESYAVGQVRAGRVVRLSDFGAFVEFEPGIEALAHVSTFPPTGTPDGWKKPIPPGTEASFEVLSVDLERKRIGVARLEEGSARASAASGRGANGSSDADGTAEETRGDRPSDAPVASAGRAPRSAGEEGAFGAAASRGGAGASGGAQVKVGARLKGKVERHESFGVFVYLAPGRTGLMPLSETATPRGSDLKKVFPVGSEVEVMVLDMEPARKRIRLSRKALLDAEEKTDAREFASPREAQESFGSIGDKLRAALAAKQK